jgi:hypothetical protein
MLPPGADEKQLKSVLDDPTDLTVEPGPFRVVVLDRKP